jgi:predicted SAM-dependent methyltransferase
VTVKTWTGKLNLGSGQYPLDGWWNVDLHCDADTQADFRDLHFTNVEKIRMSHLLEHISWRETVDVLTQVRGWLRDGGTLEVEVPDMDAIMALGTQHPLWFKYVYGDQSHAGEYHLAGFTANSLGASLRQAGFTVRTVDRFVSTHKGRDGMPCLYAEATR